MVIDKLGADLVWLGLSNIQNLSSFRSTRSRRQFSGLAEMVTVKPFEQVYPGQNTATLKPKKQGDPAEWERKQRLKEYRIAARREKRNRKSDEKKQRKLNATILRRMVRLPAYILPLLLADTRLHCIDQEPCEIRQECRTEQNASHRGGETEDPIECYFHGSTVSSST